MDFGKVTNPDRADFRLPPLSERSRAFLAARRFDGGPEVLVGAPVWARKEWAGSVYPPGARSEDLLRHYGRQFRTIELNTSFYRIPDARTVDHWRASTPEDFRFCPKVFQEISHGPGLLAAPDVVRGFVESCLQLGPRLGWAFLQLPPNFAPMQFAELERFLVSLPEGFPLAVEFRHPGWFARGELRPEAAALLERRGAATVITDAGGRRDVCHATLTSRAALVRFLGNGLHTTDYARGEAWIARIREWLDQGLREVYFFVHQPDAAPGEPDNVQVPEYIGWFIDRLNAVTGLNVRNWKPEPKQMSLLG